MKDLTPYLFEYLGGDFTLATGFTCGILAIGKAGDVGCGWEFGAGVGASISVGSSTVMKSTVTDCDCNDNE